MSGVNRLALLDAFEAVCRNDIAANKDLAMAFRRVRKMMKENVFLEAENAALKRDGKIGRA